MIKSIPGYNGKYTCNSEGCVVNTYKNKELTHSLGGRGYYHVALFDELSKPRYKPIHRLLGELFIPNPLNKTFINHKDGIKTNNDLTNLEWVSRSENAKHAYDNGLMPNNNFQKNHPFKGKFGKLHNRRKRIGQFKNGILIKEWDSQMDIHRELGYRQGTISNCCSGRNKSLHGFQWRLLD